MIDYSQLNYAKVLSELKELISQRTGRWTDQTPTDPGIVLLELFAGSAEMLANYLDKQAAETFLPTAQSRQCLINLGKLISYRLDTPVAATTSLRFSTDSPLQLDLTIPTGTSCRALFDNGDHVDFTTIQSGIIPKGQCVTDIPVRQGIPREETFEADGTKFQSFGLYPKDIAQGTIEIIDDEEPWIEVPHFQESLADNKHFQVETDGEDQSRILFGDNIRGAVPKGTITVSYLRTLGPKGNIGPNLVTQILTPVYHDQIQVRLKVTNPTPATGGTARETIEHVRRQAPAEVRSLWKAVTKADFQALAEGFPGVAKAAVLDTNDSEKIHYYSVYLVIAPEGGGPPSELLLAELQNFLESRKVVTVEIVLFRATYQEVPVDANIFAFAGHDLDLIRSRIERALADFFDFNRMNFGQTIHTSDLIALMDQTLGVSHVHLNLPIEDELIGPGAIPILGPTNLIIGRAVS